MKPYTEHSPQTMTSGVRPVVTLEVRLIGPRSVMAILLFCLAGCSTTKAPPPAVPTETPKSSKRTPARVRQPVKDEAKKPPSSPILTTKGQRLPKPAAQEHGKSVFKFYVKSEKLNLKNEGSGTVDVEDQYRTSLIEGEPKKPTRVTNLLEGPANCGPIPNATDEDSGEGKPHIIQGLVCWKAGAGHSIEFVRTGQTITIKKSSVSEDEEYDGSGEPGDGEIHRIEVPKGAKVEFEMISP